MKILIFSLPFILCVLALIYFFISPNIIKDVFTFKENNSYNLQSGIHLPRRNMRIALFGRETSVKHIIKIWPLLKLKGLYPCKFLKIK